MKLTRKLASFGAATMLLAGSLSSAKADVVQGPAQDIVETAAAAFAKLPEGTVAGFIKDKARLRPILIHHVVSGRVLSEAIAEGTSEVASGKLRIFRDEYGGAIDGANVVKADIIARNGVIHVIDAVVLPK